LAVHYGQGVLVEVSGIDAVRIRFRLSLRLRVLNDGRLVEHGRYADLYRIQAAAYATA
jgi:hypothetical protein